MSDTELLHEYVSEKSEPAFRLLVERYLPLVYAAALRQVRDAALAQDVVQVVFIILARKASGFSPKTLLPGWLFRTTRYIATKALRTEQRRRRREQEALQMQVTSADDLWQQVAPVVDAALGQLGETDRVAVLLHYFQNKRLRDVGLALGLTEDAAQKRVTRAIAKLRRILLRRGVVVPAVALPGLLMSHGALAAPAYLTADVVSAAMAKAVLPGSVGSLVHQCVSGPIFPKISRLALRFAGVALVAGGAAYLVTHWPRPDQTNSSDYTFDSRILVRPQYFPSPERKEPVLGVVIPRSNGTTAAPAAIGARQAANVPLKAAPTALTNAPPNTPNFSAGGIYTLPWPNPAPPSTPAEASANSGAGWVGPYPGNYAYYGYSGTRYTWPLPDLRAIAYTSSPAWTPAQRIPPTVTRGSATPPAISRKKTY